MAHGVSKTFGPDQGVRELDLRVPRGSLIGLIGPSGSGKTTAVRLILGAMAPEQGELRVLGKKPIDFTTKDRSRIGYLPQSSVLYPALSLRHNLNFVASTYGMPWRARRWPKRDAGHRARQRIQEVLELVDLHDVQRMRYRDASGGEKRRLALAAALVHEPELLVLDEPTAGIDPVLRRRLWEQFVRLRDDGITILVTTQLIEEASKCDLVAVQVDGRVLHVDTPDGLRRLAGVDGEAEFDDVFVELVEKDRADREPRHA